MCLYGLITYTVISRFITCIYVHFKFFDESLYKSYLNVLVYKMCFLLSLVVFLLLFYTK